MVAIRPGSVTALLAAGCLAVAAVMGALVRYGAAGTAVPDVRHYNSTFDPEYLTAKWQWRRSVFTPTLVADFLGMAGLLLLLFTAQQLRKIYRSHDGVAHRALFYCFALGGLLGPIEFLQNLGATQMADWMADPLSEWKIVGEPYKLRALDVSYTVTMARSLWIFSLVNLLVGAGLCFEYYLERRNHKEHGLRKHSIFSLSVAGVAAIGWILELAAFWSAQVLFTAGVVTLVFSGAMCAWCVWLSIFIFPHFDVNASQTMEYI